MLDWDDLRYFLAVVRGGHFAGAAKALGVAQPTVGRRIEALQRRLGTRLFQKTRAGQTLTARGQAILRLVEGLEAQALAVERAASGHDAGLSGVVRLTTTDWFARQVVSPLLGRFATRHPDIVVELLTGVRLYGLAQREADVALRLGSFPEREVVRRKLGRVTFGVYASPSYLNAHPPWQASGDQRGHALVEMVDARGLPFPDCAWLAGLAPGARTAARTTSRDAQAALAVAGLGVATLPRHFGDNHQGLRRLSTVPQPPHRDLWLGVHRDTRGTPRVKALMEFLTAEIPLLRARLAP